MPPPYSRLSQLRAVSIAIGVILLASGVVVISDQHPGCPHDHSGLQSLCLDVSTYSPYVVQGWLLIVAGAVVPVVVFWVTAYARQRRARARSG